MGRIARKRHSRGHGKGHAKNLILSIFFVLLLVGVVHAHETREYEIGDKTYKFVVGSLNEPIMVDEKTGLDLGIQLKEGDEYVNVEGLEESLQVELIADGEKKTLDIGIQWGKPGKYKANFIPTVETEYSYRIFGKVNDVPIDLIQTCSVTGHAMHGNEVNEERIEISEGVVQLLQRGSFSCPQTSKTMGFPKPVKTNLEIEHMQTEASVFSASAKKTADATLKLTIGFIALILIFIFIKIPALRKKSRK